MENIQTLGLVATVRPEEEHKNIRFPTEIDAQLSSINRQGFFTQLLTLSWKCWSQQSSETTKPESDTIALEDGSIKKLCFHPFPGGGECCRNNFSWSSHIADNCHALPTFSTHDFVDGSFTFTAYQIITSGTFVGTVLIAASSILKVQCGWHLNFCNKCSKLLK
jgi:hypothetical protein